MMLGQTSTSIAVETRPLIKLEALYNGVVKVYADDKKTRIIAHKLLRAIQEADEFLKSENKFNESALGVANIRTKALFSTLNQLKAERKASLLSAIDFTNLLYSELIALENNVNFKKNHKQLKQDMVLLTKAVAFMTDKKASLNDYSRAHETVLKEINHINAKFKENETKASKLLLWEKIAIGICATILIIALFVLPLVFINFMAPGAGLAVAMIGVTLLGSLGFVSGAFAKSRFDIRQKEANKETARENPMHSHNQNALFRAKKIVAVSTKLIDIDAKFNNLLRQS